MMHLFMKLLFPAAERPRPSPRICPCQNGGLCREDADLELACDCMSDFGGVHCEKLLGHSHSHSPGNTAAIVVPITVILLVLLAAGGVWFVIRKRPFGKMARLSNLSSSQSVSFRHGTNVEFNSPGFPPNGPTPAANVAPLDGYNLETVTTKSRDFSNPMYDAVQSGTTTEPNMENGSGE